jgi:iron complex transport system permease protein
MTSEYRLPAARLLPITAASLVVLGIAVLFGLSFGSSGDISLENIQNTLRILVRGSTDTSVAAVIVNQIRLPRVILAAAAGGVLSLAGLVFQALLRNPLAEPYILGVSGGSAVGAIIGILLGFGPFPGITLTSFAGSMMVLALVLVLALGVDDRSRSHKDSLLLGGVMMNAFCSAVIMFLISISRTSQMHSILFWLMGDFSGFAGNRLPLLGAVLPSIAVIIFLGRTMNLMLLGHESAAALGVDVKKASLTLLIATSLMVSVIVCQSGLIGFVGLVIPHIVRRLIGADHRLLIPACFFGGGAYMIFCDLLTRLLPASGQMPVGVVTALIGAPVFIFLLWREKR